MNAPDVKLTSLLLLELAKVTFRGFKRNYRGQTDSEVQTRLDDGARATRRLNRRKAWYDAHKDKDMHAVFLRDWFSYPDPAGFGVAASPIDPPDGAAGGN